MFTNKNSSSKQQRHSKDSGKEDGGKLKETKLQELIGWKDLRTAVIKKALP